MQISFKENPSDMELLNHLKMESESIGVSSFIKLLLKEDMKKKQHKEQQSMEK